MTFKERTIEHLNKMELWHLRMREAETIIGQSNPINEAYYAMNDNTEVGGKNKALRLYNSVVPKIQAHSYRMDNYFNSFN